MDSNLSDLSAFRRACRSSRDSCPALLPGGSRLEKGIRSQGVKECKKNVQIIQVDRKVDYKNYVQCINLLSANILIGSEGGRETVDRNGPATVYPCQYLDQVYFHRTF